MTEYTNTFVQQKNGASALACIAMVGNLNYDKLIEVYAGLANEDANMYGIRHVLSTNNILNVAYLDPMMFGGRLYIINVPCLNIGGKLHTIIVDLRGEEPAIIDPNLGVDDLKVYSSVDDIRHYLNVLEVIITPACEVQEHVDAPEVANAEVIAFPTMETVQ